MTYTTLLEEWEALLERRPTFREPLKAYREILVAWSRWSGERLAPLGWTAAECRERWRRGVPLLAETSPVVEPEALEDLLVPAMELLFAAGTDNEALRRFAQAWDRGEVTPAALLPAKGTLGSVTIRERLGLTSEALGFLACGGLRPILEDYFAGCRAHFSDGVWDLGVCPFCGAPAGFTDILESGGRRLACHLCGGAWIFPRLKCPHCGSVDSKDIVKFQAEEREEGYLIGACRNCHGYLKELDRRVRWNAGSALVEDWGSPHLDLVAHRAGYWRAVPTLIDLERGSRPGS
ncbi:MAG: hypothetical protein AUG00_03450 [Candidatus Rokubacteria bacterium 13_1_20CM_2_70_7]|nr:MAG: hypothetical protein AUG00_03450 [Candidatus Rokubacteria bacterium 13_1_20CM_2_70_7]